MAFPSIQPTSRQFDAGNWPVKTFNSQNGAEIRILYGNYRTNLVFALTYDNITDAQAGDFIDDYASRSGTFGSFVFDDSQKQALLAGWNDPTVESLLVAGDSLRWRYDEAPKITSVRPGISKVSVTLRGILE